MEEKMKSEADFVAGLAKLISKKFPVDEKVLTSFLNDSEQFELLVSDLFESALYPGDNNEESQNYEKETSEKGRGSQ